MEESTEAYSNVAALFVSGDDELAMLLMKSNGLNEGWIFLDQLINQIVKVKFKDFLKNYNYDSFEAYCCDTFIQTIHNRDRFYITVDKENAGHYVQYDTKDRNLVLHEGTEVKVTINYYSWKAVLNIDIMYDPKTGEYHSKLFSFVNRVIIDHDDVEVHYLGHKMYDVFMKMLYREYDDKIRVKKP